ncbi:MAG: hypothetical protein IJS52_10715 [Bacilli bacterium]|nr:hypothetical protein [Bacilli bacterium]
MHETKKQNIESNLIQRLNELVHEKTMQFFRTKDEYPIDQNVITANTFYAKVLADVALDVEPTFDQFAPLSFSEKPDVVYQSALYLYFCWKTLGINAAIYNYCRNLNRIVERSASEKSHKEEIMLPDFVSSGAEIQEVVEQVVYKN